MGEQVSRTGDRTMTADTKRLPDIAQDGRAMPGLDPLTERATGLFLVRGQFRVREAFLFGSRARGDNGSPTSARSTPGTRRAGSGCRRAGRTPRRAAPLVDGR